MKFQLPRLVRLPFLSSPGFGVAPGVDELLSIERPRYSVEPVLFGFGECVSSSVISPVGVVASLCLRLRDEEKIEVDLDFHESNLLDEALRVIFEMKVGREGVVDSREVVGPAE